MVVRDNAADIVKAVNDGGLKHVGCFLHDMHLVVTNSLKKNRIQWQRCLQKYEALFVSFVTVPKPNLC